MQRVCMVVWMRLNRFFVALALGQYGVNLTRGAVSAMPFYQGAWRNLRNGHVGMDTPIGLAVVLAFGASLYALLGKILQGIYFDSTFIFVFLLA